MNRPRPRPRFIAESARSPAQLFAHLEASLAAQDELIAVLLPPEKIELGVAERERRFWSPQLSVVVSPTEQGVRLDARFGPHPSVWTLYVALYAVTVCAAMTSAAWGLAQHLAGGTPWGLYFAPIGLVVAGLVYGASYVGQGLGSDQMYALRVFLERSL